MNDADYFLNDSFSVPTNCVPTVHRCGVLHFSAHHDIEPFDSSYLSFIIYTPLNVPYSAYGDSAQLSVNRTSRSRMNEYTRNIATLKIKMHYTLLLKIPDSWASQIKRL